MFCEKGGDRYALFVPVRLHTRVHPGWNSKVVAKMGQELQTMPPKNTAGTKHP